MLRFPLACALFFLLALSACRSPFAPDDETSKDQPTTEVGLGVHGWPLYERDVLEDGVRTDVLWPLSSVRTLSDGSVRRADILFPIAHWERDERKTRYSIRPLFDVEHETTEKGLVSDWDILWPLIGWRTAPEHSSSHIFPLWWQGRGPDSMYQVLFPLIWRGSKGDERWLHVWPLYGQSSEGTAATQYALWPLFWHHTDTEDDREEWNAFWPLLAFGHSKYGNTSRVLPFWWHERNGPDSWSMLFPLWFDSKTLDSRTQFFGPFYGQYKSADVEKKFFGGPLVMTSRNSEGTEKSFDVVWPLFHHASRPEGQTTRLFPILWSKSDEEKGYLHAWPLFGRSWDPESTVTSTVWPFFTYESRKAGGFHLNAPWPLIAIDRDATGSETRLFPLFSHVTGLDGAFSTRLGLLFHRSKSKDGERSVSFTPLFSSSRKPDGSYGGHVGLFLSNWNGDGQGHGTFHILWRLVQNDDVQVEEGDEMHSIHTLAINPFYRSERNDRGDSSWSVLFSLLKRTQRGEDVSWRFLWFFGEA